MVAVHAGQDAERVAELEVLGADQAGALEVGASGKGQEVRATPKPQRVTQRPGSPEGRAGGGASPSAPRSQRSHRTGSGQRLDSG